jgi:hypothetical protein
MASGSRRFTSPENGRILDLSFFEVGVSIYVHVLMCIPIAIHLESLSHNHWRFLICSRLTYKDRPFSDFKYFPQLAVTMQ